jgi:uncharacterized damage-inducible protein DinB
MSPEISSYLNALRELRANVFKTLEGVDAAGLNWVPTREQSNSLFILATHSIGSEHGWIFETMHRGPKTRNRPAEFQEKGDDISGLRRQYERTAGETEEILGALTEADLGTTHEAGTDGTVTTRWIILHVVRHYSEHIGQMYLTRQLYELRGQKTHVGD